MARPHFASMERMEIGHDQLVAQELCNPFMKLAIVITNLWPSCTHDFNFYCVWAWLLVSLQAYSPLTYFREHVIIL